MPMYDLRCPTCGYTEIDVLQKIDAQPRICSNCPTWTEETEDAEPQPLPPTKLERVHLPGQKTHGVNGDECDVWVRHGICNEDGSPRHYTSKSEMRKEALRRGQTNYVVHTPDSRGSDKSKQTQKFF